MQFKKFVEWSKFTARICQNQHFREICPTQFNRNRTNKEISKIEPELNGDKKWAKQISAIKNQMAGCTDPVRKYNLLVALRDHNLDIYYRYLCDNTAEVLAVLFSVDAAINDFCRMDTIIFNNLKIQGTRETIKQLDIANTVDFLKQRIIDGHKEAKLAIDLKSSLKTSSNVEAGKKLHNFLIYMQKAQMK